MERHPRLSGDSARQQRLACAGRADQKDAVGQGRASDRLTQFLEPESSTPIVDVEANRKNSKTEPPKKQAISG